MLLLTDLVDGLGTGGDDAPRFMNGIAKAPNNAAIYYPPLDYTFKTSCVISKARGIRLWSGCLPFPDGEEGCPRFFWAGNTGEDMFHFDRAYGCEFSGFSLELDAAGTAYCGVAFDDDGPGMSSKNTLKDFRIHAFRSNANYEMVSVSRSAVQNGEFYLFDNFQLSGGGGEPGKDQSLGVGIKFGGVAGQGKSMRMNNGTLSAFGTAIWQVNGNCNGSDIRCWNNEIDVRRDNATAATTLHIDTEAARQTLVDTADFPLTLAPGSRFGPQYAKSGYFTPGWLFRMEGSGIDDHAPPGVQLFDFSQRCRRATLTGNRFAPNTTYHPTDATRDELGLNSMPLDRTLVLQNNDNIVGVPSDIWLRGGTMRVELGWHGIGTFELYQAVAHKMSGDPSITPFTSRTMGNTP